ncbi:MAG: transcription activator effector binding protein [Halomonas sp.]|nr:MULTISPECIES: effector binding domain-containing protein [unclassified Halomonas]AQU83343.1 transcription activator effector binding protein [Halomonas sp. 'Soap Lake \
MPQAVIDTWSSIWEHFGSGESKHIRAYTTDFELYKSGHEVDIFIAIK